MENHRKALKATLTGLLLAATFAGSSARADVLDKDCLASARQSRRACVLACSASGNCAMEYKAAHAECIADTVPGPERQSCVLSCKDDRIACRVQTKTCKTGCGQEFQVVKVGCGAGH
jgi:hypothetical protein